MLRKVGWLMVEVVVFAIVLVVGGVVGVVGGVALLYLWVERR